jgi:hypothetical protein
LQPPLLEPALQLSGTGLSFKPTLHLHVVVGAGVLAQVKNTAKPSALAIGGTEHHPSNPGLHQGAGTHRAGLEGHDQGAVVEAPVLAQPGGLLQCHQFGVAQRVLIVLPSVTAPAHGPAAAIQHHCSHGNFTLGPHRRCAPQQAPHPQALHRVPQNPTPSCLNNGSV